MDSGTRVDLTVTDSMLQFIDEAQHKSVPSLRSNKTKHFLSKYISIQEKLAKIVDGTGLVTEKEELLTSRKTNVYAFLKYRYDSFVYSWFQEVIIHFGKHPTVTEFQGICSQLKNTVDVMTLDNTTQSKVMALLDKPDTSEVSDVLNMSVIYERLSLYSNDKIDAIKSQISAREDELKQSDLETNGLLTQCRSGFETISSIEKLTDSEIAYLVHKSSNCFLATSLSILKVELAKEIYQEVVKTSRPSSIGIPVLSLEADVNTSVSSTDSASCVSSASSSSESSSSTSPRILPAVDNSFEPAMYLDLPTVDSSISDLAIAYWHYEVVCCRLARAKENDAKAWEVDLAPSIREVEECTSKVRQPVKGRVDQSDLVRKLAVKDLECGLMRTVQSWHLAKVHFLEVFKGFCYADGSFGREEVGASKDTMNVVCVLVLLHHAKLSTHKELVAAESSDPLDNEEVARLKHEIIVLDAQILAQSLSVDIDSKKLEIALYAKTKHGERERKHTKLTSELADLDQKLTFANANVTRLSKAKPSVHVLAVKSKPKRRGSSGGGGGSVGGSGSGRTSGRKKIDGVDDGDVEATVHRIGPAEIFRVQLKTLSRVLPIGRAESFLSECDVVLETLSKKASDILDEFTSDQSDVEQLWTDDCNSIAMQSVVESTRLWISKDEGHILIDESWPIHHPVNGPGFVVGFSASTSMSIHNHLYEIKCDTGESFEVDEAGLRCIMLSEIDSPTNCEAWKKYCQDSNGKYPAGFTDLDLALRTAIDAVPLLRKEVVESLTSLALSVNRMKPTSFVAQYTPINDEIEVEKDGALPSTPGKHLSSPIDMSSVSLLDTALSSNFNFATRSLEEETVEARESVIQKLKETGADENDEKQVLIGLRLLEPSSEYLSIIDQVKNNRYPERDDLEVEYDFEEASTGNTVTQVRRLRHSCPYRAHLRQLASENTFVSQTVSI